MRLRPTDATRWRCAASAIAGSITTSASTFRPAFTPGPAWHERRANLPAPLIAISPATHALYHDWEQALRFCRDLPDVAPAEPAQFHMFWRQRRAGFLRKARPFGRKQALPVKAFFATQDLSRCPLTVWSDAALPRTPWLTPLASRLSCRVYDP